MSRIFAIPDIHGRSDLLDDLMHELWEHQGLDLVKDKLVFLGDMVDRGPSSKNVVEHVRALVEENPGRVIALRGNHEQFAIDARRAADERARFEMHQLWCLPNNGGSATLFSFGGSIPADVLDWFAALPLFHEEPGFFFSHAPAPRENRRSIMRRGQPFLEEELMWTYTRDEFGFARNFSSEPRPGTQPAECLHVIGPEVVGVCGHIHALEKNYLEPRMYPHYIFADAGCGCSERAPLCAVEVRSRQIISAWPKTRKGKA